MKLGVFRPSARPAIGLAALAGIGAFLSVFPDRLQDHFRLTTTEFGLLLNCGAVAGVARTLLGRPLLARIGDRRMLRICLAGGAAGMLLAAWSGSCILFLVALSLTAFFVAPLNIALQTYLAALYPDRRRRIVALIFVAVSVFGMLFPLLVEFLLSLARPGSRADFAWILHGLFAATAIVFLGGLAAGTRRTGGESHGKPIDAATMPLGAVVLLVALLVLHGTADSVLAIWVPRVLSSRSYIDQPFLPGVVMAAFSFAYVVSRFLLSLLPEDRWRRRMMILPGLLGGSLATPASSPATRPGPRSATWPAPSAGRWNAPSSSPPWRALAPASEAPRPRSPSFRGWPRSAWAHPSECSAIGSQNSRSGRSCSSRPACSRSSGSAACAGCCATQMQTARRPRAAGRPAGKPDRLLQAPAALDVGGVRASAPPIGSRRERFALQFH